MVNLILENKRELLLPWILLMVGDIFVELLYAIHFIFSKRANFEPIVGFIFTIDLFIVCLNIYCLLCVVSQYQVYKRTVNPAHQQKNFTAECEAENENYCETTAASTGPLEPARSYQTAAHLIHKCEKSELKSTILEEEVWETHL